MTDRNVAVVTGTRAEYGLLKSSMREIQRSGELELSTIVTGMHLSPQHGYTIDDIRHDGFEITRTVDMLIDGDTGVAMAKSLGIGISGLAEAFRDVDPDIILVLGDRDEAFAAGLAAAHMNIPVAHVHGGDSMRGAVIDDSIRHALTKFAHIHFPATETSEGRILKLGEEQWRTTIVGAPGLDDVLDGKFTRKEDVLEELSLSADEPLAVTVQHPLTTRPTDAGSQMTSTLDALAKHDVQVVLIYPNADAGGKEMIDAIESHPSFGSIQPFKSLPRETYLGLLDAADLMVGNSSSAIIEAPSFDLPVVDIGPRQGGRERADNVLEVPHDTDAIEEAIDACLHDEEIARRARECENPYDYGGAADAITERLETVPIDDRLLQKQLTYDDTTEDES